MLEIPNVSRMIHFVKRYCNKGIGATFLSMNKFMNICEGGKGRDRLISDNSILTGKGRAVGKSFEESSDFSRSGGHPVLDSRAKGNLL